MPETNLDKLFEALKGKEIGIVMQKIPESYIEIAFQDGVTLVYAENMPREVIKARKEYKSEDPSPGCALSDAFTERM